MTLTASCLSSDDLALVREVAGEAYRYFLDPVLHAGGLVRDSARPGSPCSVAAAGFAAAAHVAADSLGLAERDDALAACLDIAESFASLPDDAGKAGLFFHFLEADGPGRGGRAWRCEVSTIDTALLIAGLLVARGHFDRDDPRENRLRGAIDLIADRVDWTFCLRPDNRLCHGWRPEAATRPRLGHDARGFIEQPWDGYSEGLILYLVAAGSRTHPIPRESYDAWLSTYPRHWQIVEGVEHLHAPPLFIHQFPLCFVDLRDRHDRFNRERSLTYHENARRATLAQIAYASRNPGDFPGYGSTTWGLSASNGPGIDHKRRLKRNGGYARFWPYVERGVAPPDRVVDDGTLAPWAAAACLPFAPTQSVAAIRGHREARLCRPGWRGFMGSYNLAYVDDTCPHGWADEYDLAIEQAPIVIMAANALCDGVWRATRDDDTFARGLDRCGYRASSQENPR